MPRTRLIHPEAPKDEAVAQMSVHARLAWAYLPCHADREGRMEDKPFNLRLGIFPTDAVDMNAILNELAATELIERYQVGERRYIQIRNFAKYQAPHKNEARSFLPPPVGHGEAEQLGGFVYFIQEEGGAIKIGSSDSPQNRLMELQTANPRKLSLLGKIRGGYREKEIHARFVHLRRSGEWFEATDELLEFILRESDANVVSAPDVVPTSGRDVLSTRPDPDPVKDPVSLSKKTLEREKDLTPRDPSATAPAPATVSGLEWLWRKKWEDRHGSMYLLEPGFLGHARSLVESLEDHGPEALAKGSSLLPACIDRYFADDKAAKHRHPFKWFCERFPALMADVGGGNARASPVRAKNPIKIPDYLRRNRST